MLIIQNELFSNIRFACFIFKKEAQLGGKIQNAKNGASGRRKNINEMTMQNRNKEMLK